MPKSKKIKEINKDHTLKVSSFKIGQRAITKKTIKNTIPKLRLVANLIQK